MTEAAKNQLIKQLKRKVITFPESDTVQVDYQKEVINRLIPHRPPFNLVDKINKISLSEQTIAATTTISKEDPIFEGHFPEQPVYPGVLQIEMMGQVGLCLSAFVIHQTTDGAKTKPVKGLFTRVHNAGFIGQVFPGDQLIILAQMVEFDEFLGIVAAQILKAGKIISHSISEVYFLDSE